MLSSLQKSASLSIDVEENKTLFVLFTQ